jgi:hypothetical protein
LLEVSWLFLKARAKRPYLSHTGRSAAAEEKQPTGPGPEGCDETLLYPKRVGSSQAVSETPFCQRPRYNPLLAVQPCPESCFGIEAGRTMTVHLIRFETEQVIPKSISNKGSG